MTTTGDRGIGRITLLDGLVTINSEPYTDVLLRDSTFRRWSSAEISQHLADVRRWRRWRWLPRFVKRRRDVPLSEPRDRTVTILRCHFVGGSQREAVNVDNI